MSWYHLEDTTPIARKNHICHLCGHLIKKGERHVSRSGIDDDGLVRIHMHTNCEKSTTSWDNGDWECHDSGSFREHLEPIASRPILSSQVCLSGELPLGMYENWKNPFPRPALLPARYLAEGDCRKKCGQCGSSLKRKWFFKVVGCYSPHCPNYWNRKDTFSMSLSS